MLFSKLSLTSVWIVSCLCALFAFSQGSLVLVNVTVTDPLNRYVNGLQKTHFRLYENGAARPITYFEQRSVPLTMAIVCEVTGGPTDMYKQCRYGIRRYLESANAQDEFILVAYDGKAAMVERATREKSEVEGIRSFGQIAGLSHLEEAIYGGLNRIKTKTGKKALVLVSTADPGTLSYSWYVVYKGWELSEHPEFQIYTIQNSASPQSGSGKKSRNEPQGNAYISDVEEVGYYLDLIYEELRNQYVLGFPASASRSSLKGRQISVQIDRPAGVPKLKSKTGQGYYAPQP